MFDADDSLDETVQRAMQKWPNVPHCLGWLRLDERGDWWLWDEASSQYNNRIQHQKMREFIHRNYTSDLQGQWFFQNGPQRVYVELALAPWIWRIERLEVNKNLQNPMCITSHTGRVAKYQSSLVDAQGMLYLQTNLGWGVVHTQDMVHCLPWIEANFSSIHQTNWTTEEVAAACGFVCFPYIFNS